MQRRINKPKWAPTIYIKDMSAYRFAPGDRPDEQYKYLRAYIDEYGLTLVYEKINEIPRFRYKHYFSVSVYLYASDIRQGISLSNIIKEEIANGYTKNAERILWRQDKRKIKTIEQLIKALEDADRRQIEEPKRRRRNERGKGNPARVYLEHQDAKSMRSND